MENISRNPACPTDEAVGIAAGRLGITPEEARLHCGTVPGVPGAWFFAAAERGGGRLLVSAGGETLWAASGVNPLMHAEAFRAGRRS